jgi:hypothetical protein
MLLRAYCAFLSSSPHSQPTAIPPNLLRFLPTHCDSAQPTAIPTFSTSQAFLASHQTYCNCQSRRSVVLRKIPVIQILPQSSAVFDFLLGNRDNVTQFFPVPPNATKRKKTRFPERAALSSLSLSSSSYPFSSVYTTKWQRDTAFSHSPALSLLPFWWQPKATIQMGREVFPYSTKLATGLRSAARNNKATRLLTRPG